MAQRQWVSWVGPGEEGWEDTKKMVVTVVSAVFNGKNDSRKKRRPVDRRRRPDAWRKVQGRKKRGNTNEMVVVKRERVPLRY